MFYLHLACDNSQQKNSLCVRICQQSQVNQQSLRSEEHPGQVAGPIKVHIEIQSILPVKSSISLYKIRVQLTSGEAFAMIHKSYILKTVLPNKMWRNLDSLKRDLKKYLKR